MTGSVAAAVLCSLVLQLSSELGCAASGTAGWYPRGRAGWGAGTAPKQLLLIVPAAGGMSDLVLGRLMLSQFSGPAGHEDLAPTQCYLQ